MTTIAGDTYLIYILNLENLEQWKNLMIEPEQRIPLNFIVRVFYKFNILHISLRANYFFDVYF